MKVTVKHFIQLKQQNAPKIQHIDVVQDASVDDLVAVLNLKKEEIGIMIINGKQAVWGQKLKDNDVVTLIPHIGGG